MKKLLFNTLLIGGFFFIGGVPFKTIAQQYEGNWEGKLEIKKRKLAFVFHITSLQNNAYSVKMDIPEQKVFNVAAGDVIANDQSIEIRYTAFGIKIVGIPNGPQKLKCIFEQSGVSLPMELKNTGLATAGKTFNRPQTPAPPFPYVSEEVAFDNTEGSIHFGGTLTYPNSRPTGTKRYPAILLITGSGPQDRDETLYDHKPFAVLADFLTREGYAVLRVDDRSMGKTTSFYLSSTTADFANDAETALSYLKKRPDIDTANLGLLGHSEGGLIAAMIASRRNDIGFVILAAAPVADPIDLAAEQSADILVSNGVPEARVQEFRPLLRDIFTAFLAAPDSIAAVREASKVFISWQENQTRKTTRLTTGVTDEQSMQRFIQRLWSRLSTPWYQYFMRLHPAEYYKLLTCKVLAVYGNKDVQVDPLINSEQLRIYLKDRKTGQTEIAILPGLNHLFQTCKKCTFSEYADIEETLAPALLEVIGRWLNKNIDSSGNNHSERPVR